MPAVVDRRLVTDSFIAMLIAGTGKKIGDHRVIDKPEVDPETNEVQPYAIVYSIPGGGTSGPHFGDADSDAALVYQVSSVGASRKQAEWMADLVRRTVLTRSASGGWAVPMVPIAGWSVVGRLLDGTLGGIDQAGVAPNLTFTVAERFLVQITPS